MGTSKITVDIDKDLWWFNGENPGGGYNVQATLTATPTTGTFKWDVIAGAAVVDLNKGGVDGDTITVFNDNTITVKSTGASTGLGDVTIALTYNGVAVCTRSLTVRKPGTPQLLSGFPTDEASYAGFKTRYRFKIVDQFGADIPFEMPINESFGAWTSDWLLESWVDPSPNSIMTENKILFETYGMRNALYPDPVNPGMSGQWDPIQHATQYYRAGSSTLGAGILIKQHTIQIYRGRARQL